MFDGENCIRCGKHCKFEELKVLPNSFGLCAECAIKLDPTREPKRMCPHDGSEMRKDIFQDRVLMDKCDLCSGVWLDSGELEIIRDLAFRAGQATGAGWGWIAAVLSISIW